jgi:predicted ribosome quality control (RQC) complex YloA/Tae2 family protein
MGLSARHVGELVQELAPLVRGATVRGVQPLPPHDLLLAIRPRDPALGELLRVRLSADPVAGRLHLVIASVKRHEGPAAPFFARAEEALAGTEWHALEQVQADRVVRATFRRDGRPSAALVAELTGRHANLVLLDGAGRVLDCLVQPGRESAAATRLAPGCAYALPPGRRAPGEPGPSLSEAFPVSGESGRASALAPLSARVEQALGSAAAERFDDEQRRELVRRLERRLAGARALVAGLERRASACAEAARLRMDGDLLLAHLASVPRGAKEVELPDSFAPDSPARRITLDPGLTPRRNAERYFARYKKLVRTLERLPGELALATEEVQRVEQWLARAGDEPPEVVEAEAVAAGVLTPAQEPRTARRAAGTPAPRLPFLRFAGLRGTTTGSPSAKRAATTCGYTPRTPPAATSSCAWSEAASRTPRKCSTPPTWPCTSRPCAGRRAPTSTSRARRRSTSPARPPPAW